MKLCPVCNAFKEIELSCPECHSSLEDKGKVSDFLDPYGHYNDEETVKMGDGYSDTAKKQICPHLMYCNHCGYDAVKFIQEE
ncbi:hypothetical protein [Bacillus badius]|uniref:Uncharacterized protein n=1 Tax=Bacillus badius TaxID=1455 RepID=A0ABR5AZJ8_BACBA|nr:hypothetical protein [Bacillus badius]KIL74878.1 hypothetical protein SD78_1947 [Bacillus badius]KIL80143.1 hypothetical protein SD77_2597 [Bacillus badius]KZR60045.1 hypothetical protein A3781_07525 [Bacillus badius]MED4718527.1 hypothetical protein [Bacillus badius]